MAILRSVNKNETAMGMVGSVVERLDASDEADYVEVFAGGRLVGTILVRNLAPEPSSDGVLYAEAEAGERQ